MNDLLGFLTDNCCHGSTEKFAPPFVNPPVTNAQRLLCHETDARPRFGEQYRRRHWLLLGFVLLRPSVVKDDYAKRMLDDPRVNFAISSRGNTPGLDHLGIQVESESELQDVYSRLREVGQNVVKQGKTTCCYAKSEKSWVDDPAGISWEAFFTSGESTNYGASFDKGARIAHAEACCEPQS